MCVQVHTSCTYTHTLLTYRENPSLEHIHHSLDVWHKACKLSKKLTEVYLMCNFYTSYYYYCALKSANQSLRQWIAPIRNHFWWCCMEANEYATDVVPERMRECICSYFNLSKLFTVFFIPPLYYRRCGSAACIMYVVAIPGQGGDVLTLRKMMAYLQKKAEST